jgi:hypothetical protein
MQRTTNGRCRVLVSAVHMMDGFALRASLSTSAGSATPHEALYTLGLRPRFGTMPLPVFSCQLLSHGNEPLAGISSVEAME